MAKPQSPLLGYNTNVRHKGRVFHIQTEDSGVTKPHVITHLFADGGRIIKSVKTSYADRLDAVDLQAQVKKLMQDQHKAMFVALRDGVYDDTTESPSPAPASAIVPPAAPAAAPASHAALASATAPGVTVPGVTAPGVTAPGVTAPGVTAPGVTAPGVTAPGVTAPGVTAPGVTAPGVTAPAPPSVDSDDLIELDESSFVEEATPSEAVSTAPLSFAPPPLQPAASAQRPHVSPRQSQGWSVASGRTSPPPLHSSQRATATAPMGQPTLAAAATKARSDKRTPAPVPRVGAVFGERLVSERSLDAVILAYLTEDPGEKPPR